MVLAFLLLASGVFGYWREECRGFPDYPFFLPDNTDLDCSLRHLAVDYATKVLGSDRAGIKSGRIAQAFNMGVCKSTNLKASIGKRAGWGAPPLSASAGAVAAHSEIFVSPASAGGCDATGDGSIARPYATVTRAQAATRETLQGQRKQQKLPNGQQKQAGVTVWLRSGVYYQGGTDPHNIDGPLTFTHEDSGLSPDSPVIYASYPGDKDPAVLSGGVLLQDGSGKTPSSPPLPWAKVGAEEQKRSFPGARVPVYKATLSAALMSKFKGGLFTGMFTEGRMNESETQSTQSRTRLVRARYPNCEDITGTGCFTLNASGAIKSGVTAPTHDIADDPRHMNLDVVNENGVDMFADKWDNAKSTGPHGASDGTLAAGQNLSLIVEHPDYAWRCHEDCGWQAYSKWRGRICDGKQGKATIDCRMDPTHNMPYWDQQVSSGFYYNATAGIYIESYIYVSNGAHMTGVCSSAQPMHATNPRAHALAQAWHFAGARPKFHPKKPHTHVLLLLPPPPLAHCAPSPLPSPTLPSPYPQRPHHGRLHSLRESGKIQPLASCICTTLRGGVGGSTSWRRGMMPIIR
jgi:hypothetical protein